MKESDDIKYRETYLLFADLDDEIWKLSKMTLSEYNKYMSQSKLLQIINELRSRSK